MQEAGSQVSSARTIALPDKRAKGMRSKMNSRFRTQGIIFGAISGITFGFYGVVSGMAMETTPFLALSGVFIIPMVATAVCDTFSAIYVTIFNIIRGSGKEIIRSLKTFPGLMAMLCGLIGGPLANGALLVGISLAGATYAMPISALCPVFGAIFARIFLKQKLSVRIGAGMAICIAGAIVISYVAPESAPPNFYLGIACAFLAALSWGLEGVVGTFGMSMIDSNIAINIRQTTSSLLFLLFIVPVLCGGWIVLPPIVENPYTLALLAIGALACATSYLTWYAANSRVGVATGMTLNVTYVLWGVVFAVIIIGQVLTAQVVIGAIAIMGGAVLVSTNPLDLFRKKEV
jgi:drug/metabolite transporter (DMT)-like permease